MNQIEKVKQEIKELQLKSVEAYASIKSIDDEIKSKEKELIVLQNRELKFLEIKNILLDALIVGAGGFKVRYGSTAPYSHGYYVSHPDIKGFCEPVSCTGTWYEELPKILYDYLIDKLGWDNVKFAELEEQVKEEWSLLPDGYDPTVYTTNKDQYLHGNYIANGYEKDGFDEIVRGRCHGTWSSMTPSAQNELAESLIVLKGYCPDVYFSRKNDKYLSQEFVKEVYSRHNLDSDLSDLNAWAKRNPSKCGSDKECFISKNDIVKPRTKAR